MGAEGPGFLYTLAVFLPSLTLLVFIHELGHFSVARYFGVKVDVFSIGFGKALWSRKDKHGTRWQIASIPLGGYVKFFGDASSASNPSAEVAGYNAEERSVSYHCKPVYQRALISIAGPLANFALALVIYSGLFLTYGDHYAPSVIGTIVEESAAEKSGLLVGDRITEIDGQEVNRFTEMRNIVVLEAGRTLDFVFVRNGEQMAKPIEIGTMLQKDRYGNLYAYGQLGVGASTLESEYPGFWGSIGAGGRKIVGDIQMMYTTIKQLILGMRSIGDLGGPVSLAAILGQVAQAGFVTFLTFLAIISVNLGFVNLLPIPALDGGHLMLYGVEAIKGSPLNQRATEYVFMAGALFVMSLMAFLIVNDIFKLTGNQLLQP